MVLRHPSAVGFSIVVAILAAPAAALDIEGVQNAALDQPRINAAIRLPGATGPLSATVEDPFNGGTTETFNIQAFYDTGASGVLVSDETADALGLPREPGVVFEDVGVGGSEFFDVSQPVEVLLANFTADTDVDNPATFSATYNRSYGPLRTQVVQHPSTLGIPLDVFGMPLFQGTTAVFDARALNQVEGTLETRLYNSGSVPSTVPAADYRVQMDFGDFARFTQTSDPAKAPAMSQNPFIGQNPVDLLDGGSPDPGAEGVRTTHNGQTRETSWLFDTGAAASIISEDVAGLHGVTVEYEMISTPDGPEERPYLEQDGQRIVDQFYLAIGGVGGSRTVAGFWLEELALPTMEGEEIVFKRAPVLVANITVADPLTDESLTLDGILGMNFLVASAFIDSSSPFPFPDDITAGAFDFFTYDQTSNVLGLTLNPAFVPEPASLGLLLAASLMLIRRR